MAGVLKYTLIRLHPDSGIATPLLEGKPVPAWASDLVEADDIVGGSKESVKADAKTDGSPYAGLKSADLKAEIAKRNEGREDAAKISDKGAIAVLVAALEADDKAVADAKTDDADANTAPGDDN